jgi:hypothetical protein
MGVAEAEANGEEWELEEPSLEYVPGMGLGATKEATRWAWMGYHLEKRRKIGQHLKRPRGRPRKEPLETTDAFRAFTLWRLAQHLDEDARRRISSRALVTFARQVEASLDVPQEERAFPVMTEAFDRSVSEGKKLLEIDNAWNSSVCEKIATN